MMMIMKKTLNIGVLMIDSNYESSYSFSVAWYNYDKMIKKVNDNPNNFVLMMMTIVIR